jgi:membrane peptidoglycan carboxypeptidase
MTKLKFLKLKKLSLYWLKRLFRIKRLARYFPIIVVIALTLGFTFFTIADLWLTTPVLALPTDTQSTKGTLVIDKNTNQIVSNYTQKSNLQPVSIYTIPQNLIQAVLTLEDQNFFQNPSAIPWSSILKVNLECLAKSSDCRGGSGIVQQLVKNVSGDDSPTFGRKINELFLSLKLSQKVSREVILEAYLNNVFYGQNSYGVQTASQTYFDHAVSAKDSSQKYLLSDSKACFLASLLQSPNIYSKSVFGENNSTSAFASRIDFCL